MIPNYKPNSLAIKAPWLEKEWHPDNPKKFHEVAFRSNLKYDWVCAELHIWPAPPYSRTSSKNPSGCPECAGYRVSAANSLATKAPHLEAEWHPDNPKKFHEVCYGSHEKYDWVCRLQHVYPASPHARTAKNPRGCPECAGKKVSSANSLATKAPWLEKEWSPSNTKKFHEVSYGSEISRDWVCAKTHIWPASPCNRARDKNPSGCPICAKQRSGMELSIFEAVQQKYPDALNGPRKLLKQKRSELDIYIPSLKKAIEFDGTYWHSRPGCAERDARKNEQCAQAGIQLLRIPEADYESNPTGIISKIIQWLDTPTPPVQ